jgi:hypothetical protein
MRAAAPIAARWSSSSSRERSRRRVSASPAEREDENGATPLDIVRAKPLKRVLEKLLRGDRDRIR